MKTATIIIFVIILILIAVGAYFVFFQKTQITSNSNQNQQISASYNIQGMKVETLKQGSGDATKAGDVVTVNYVGTLQDGTKFDSSIDRGTPFKFTLGQNSVIQGWELGVLGMKVGEKRKLTIPSELGYGAQGAGGIIPPNATLIFEIDLLAINGK